MDYENAKNALGAVPGESRGGAWQTVAFGDMPAWNQLTEKSL